MEKKQITKINLNGLKNVLSPKEMKNITGGSIICHLSCDWGSILGTCAGTDPCECERYGYSGCMVDCGC